MSIDILLIGFVCLIIAPLYLMWQMRFRNKFDDKLDAINTSKYKPYLVTALFLFILVVIFVFFASTFLVVINRDGYIFDFKLGDFLVLFLILFFQIFIAFGVGIYLVAISLAPGVAKNANAFGTGSFAVVSITRFRGSISHILFISGTFLSLFLVSLLENWNLYFNMNYFEVVFTFCCGVVFGVVFCVSQYISNTWKHQLPLIIFLYILQTYVFFNSLGSIMFMPITIAFTTAVFVLLVFDLYLLFRYHSGKLAYKYD